MMSIWQDEHGIHFRGTLRWTEYPRLDPFDGALVRDCSGEGRVAADWLLALECLFRRAHEQALR